VEAEAEVEVMAVEVMVEEMAAAARTSFSISVQRSASEGAWTRSGCITRRSPCSPVVSTMWSLCFSTSSST
jgi:hypothetical protein